MATTPDLPQKSQKPAPTPRNVVRKDAKVIISKQVFTDFAAI
ncbi:MULTISPECIES: hypothetical protein [Roseovarius]|nr:hypothetical protein [Roseovarius atlanticus]